MGVHLPRHYLFIVTPAGPSHRAGQRRADGTETTALHHCSLHITHPRIPTIQQTSGQQPARISGPVFLFRYQSFPWMIRYRENLHKDVWYIYQLPVLLCLWHNSSELLPIQHWLLLALHCMPSWPLYAAADGRLAPHTGLVVQPGQSRYHTSSSSRV